MKRSTKLLFLAFVLPLSSLAMEKEMLVSLIEDGRIEINAKGTGTHSGESIEVMLKNTSSKPFTSSIPVGWVFISETPEVQDLLVVREELFALSPGNQTTVFCKAFCCESSGIGPDENEPYRKGRLANKELVQVAMAAARKDQFIPDGFDDHTIQHAIWVLSDGHDISSMGAMDSTLTDSLRMAVSRLSGQEPPLYSLTYAEGGEGVCSGRPEWITRTAQFNVPAGAKLTVVALGHKKQILEVLQDRETLEPGVHELTFRVHVLDWPDGDYAIRAHLENGAGARLMPFQL